MRLSSRSLLLAGVASTALLIGCGVPMRDQHVKNTLDQFLNKANGKSALTTGNKTIIVPLRDNGCDRGHQMPLIPTPNYKAGGALGGGMFGGFGGGMKKYNNLVERIIATTLVTGNMTQVVELSTHNFATGLVKPVAGGAVTVVDVLQNVNWALEGGRIVNTVTGPDMCLLTIAKERNANTVFAYEILELGGKRAKIHYRISDVATGVVKAEGTFLAAEGTPYDANFVEVPDAK